MRLLSWYRIPEKTNYIVTQGLRDLSSLTTNVVSRRVRFDLLLVLPKHFRVVVHQLTENYGKCPWPSLLYPLSYDLIVCWIHLFIKVLPYLTTFLELKTTVYVDPTQGSGTRFNNWYSMIALKDKGERRYFNPILRHYLWRPWSGYRDPSDMSTTYALTPSSRRNKVTLVWILRGHPVRLRWDSLKWTLVQVQTDEGIGTEQRKRGSD